MPFGGAKSAVEFRYVRETLAHSRARQHYRSTQPYRFYNPDHTSCQKLPRLGRFLFHKERHSHHDHLSLRANIAETLLVPLITEQGGKEIQHEEHEDILSGPVRGAQ